jgi:hypothetical protein
MIETIKEVFYYVDLLLIQYYGWVLFLWLLIWLVYNYLKIENIGKYMSGVKWVFLEVKVDETNERSPLAMEQVFGSLHAIHTAITWGEAFNGKVVLWMSCEIVSLGGRVSYIVKIPEKYRTLFENAVFAQYPKAEIYEVEDYLKNLPKEYNPETAEFDFFAVQLNKRKDGAKSMFPIKTYGGFEHTEQETIVDPLASVIEVMSNIQPYEMMASQIVIKPVQEDWKKEAEPLLDKLKGKPEKGHEPGAFEKVFLLPFQWIGDVIMDLLGMGIEAPKKEKDAPPSLMQHLSEGEKQVIAAAEHMLDKISYEVRVRIMYLAPKDKFNKGLRVPELIGAYRNFDEPSLNGLKPDMSASSTEMSYKFIEKFEKPYLKKKIITKKRRIYTYFKNRAHWEGTGGKNFMNTEELATIYHFPQVPNARVSGVESVKTVKSAPPSDLPVG